MNNPDSSPKMHLLSVSSAAGDLWAAFRAGDREALAKIYRLHIDDLYHYGMHFCKDRELVKDCLQDLFRNLWEEREQLTPAVKHLRYYLVVSLRRRLLRALQKNRTNKSDQITDSYDFEFVLSQEDRITGEEIDQEKVAYLKKIISTLSRRQREVVYLRFYQNLSYKEIAKIMDMQVDSAYNLISKAIGLLRSIAAK